MNESTVLTIPELTLSGSRIATRLQSAYNDAMERQRNAQRCESHKFHYGRALGIIRAYAEVFDLTFAQAADVLAKSRDLEASHD